MDHDWAWFGEKICRVVSLLPDNNYRRGSTSTTLALLECRIDKQTHRFCLSKMMRLNWFVF